MPLRLPRHKSNDRIHNRCLFRFGIGSKSHTVRLPTSRSTERSKLGRGSLIKFHMPAISAQSEASSIPRSIQPNETKWQSKLERISIQTRLRY